jgi:hypothetical protein
MKQTAIQQAIVMVKSRIDSIDETLMGKHTIHHLQQIERGLYDLLEMEKEQIQDAYLEGDKMEGRASLDDAAEYYEETYGKDA